MLLLESEELQEKINNDYFTDEAKIVAQQILKERNFTEKTIENSKVFSDEIFNNDKIKIQSKKVNIELSNIIIWSTFAFLFGLGQGNFKAIPINSPAAIVIKFANGIFYAVIVALAIIAIANFRPKTPPTDSELIKKYLSNVKTVIVSNVIISVIYVLLLIFSERSFFLSLDLIVVSGLTIAIVNKIKYAKHFLVAYSFMNPVALALADARSASTFFWSFIFLNACQALIIEKKFNEIEKRKLHP